jgi:hypothetical protein
MKNYTKTLKAIAFSLGLAFLGLTANNLNAQNARSRGLFDRGASFENAVYGSKTLFQINGERSGAGDATIIGSGIQNGNFVEVSPLGSGIAIMLVAGLGYVALKKKEDKQ